MSEWTLHTGCMGDRTKINIDWFDHNNVRQFACLEISIQDQDKPRTLEIRVNGVVIAVIPNDSTPLCNRWNNATNL